MQCPRCGSASEVCETRPAALFTIKRRRRCSNGHRFVTIEMHLAAMCSAKQRLANLAKTIEKRVSLWRRDREIAQALPTVGWKALARRFNLEKSAVFLAAKRGRSDVRGVSLPTVPHAAQGSAPPGAAHADVPASPVPLHELHVPAPAPVGSLQLEPGLASSPRRTFWFPAVGPAGSGGGGGLEHEGQTDEGLAL